MFEICRKFALRRAHPLGIAIMAAVLTLSGPTAFAENAARSTTRQIYFRSISPPFGVEMRVDGAKPAAVAIGAQLALDGRKHHLSFDCVRDLCEPVELSVGAGPADEQVDVVLNIRPAQIQIEGNLAHRFAIQEEPSLGSACAGVVMAIPLHSGERVVHVIDQQTSRSIAVVLTAGQTTLVSFF